MTAAEGMLPKVAVLYSGLDAAVVLCLLVGFKVPGNFGVWCLPVATSFGGSAFHNSYS